MTGEIAAEEIERAGLTPAELEAISDPEEEATDTTEDADVEGGDDNEQPEQAEDEGADGEDPADTGADAEGGQEADEDEEAEQQEQEAQEQPEQGQAGDLDFTADDLAVAFVPKLSGVLLPDFEEAVTKEYSKADEQLAALETRYETGEIEEAVYKQEVRRHERLRDAEIRKLEAASSNTEVEMQLWQAEQQAFFKANPQYSQPILYNALNAEVIRIVNLPEAAGKNGLQVLAAAKRVVEQQLQAVTDLATNKDSQPKQPEKAAIKRPAAKRPDVPTLAGVPQAAAADVGADKWSHLDKLSGMAFESALAKLSEADQQAYLAGR